MSLEAFFAPEVWGSTVEQEVRRRIKVSVAAYAYEFCDDSIMSDAEFDKLCLEINTNLDTNNKKLNKYFREHFDKNTGQWIRKHPELDKIANLYVKYYKS